MGRSKLSEEQALDLDFASEFELTTVSGILRDYTTTVSGILQTQHNFHIAISNIHFPWQDVGDHVTTVSGALDEKFYIWRRIHLAPTGQLGTGGLWADYGIIHDFPVVIFSNVIDEQMVLTYRANEQQHVVEDPKIIISTTSASIAPQAGDQVRWKLEIRSIACGESLGKVFDYVQYITQTLDDDPSYLYAETRNIDLIFDLDISIFEIDDMFLIKLTRLATDILDTFSANIALTEIWYSYYGT